MRSAPSTAPKRSECFDERSMKQAHGREAKRIHGRYSNESRVAFGVVSCLTEAHSSSNSRIARSICESNWDSHDWSRNRFAFLPHSRSSRLLQN